MLALQDKLAYGPTFESAMRALFGRSFVAKRHRGASGTGTKHSSACASFKPGTDLNAIVAEAAKDLADYQRLTAEGKVGEAGQKLEQLKRKLDQLNTREK